jgi:hypothetical protein
MVSMVADARRDAETAQLIGVKALLKVHGPIEESVCAGHRPYPATIQPASTIGCS